MAAASDADGVGGSDSSGIRGHSRQAAFASPSPQERRAADSSVMRRFYPSLPAEQSDACLFSQQTAVPSASPARGPTQADASGVHTSQQPRSSYVASCGNWSDLDFSSVVWTRPQPASPRMSTLGGNASHPSSSSPFPSPLRGFCSCLKRIRRRVFSCTLKTHSECAWPSRRLNVWLSRLGDRVAFYIVEHPDFFLKRAGVCGVLLFLLTLVSAGISFGVPYLDPNETLRVDLEKAGCASATTPSSLSVFFEGNTTALPGHVGRLGGVDRLLSETGSRQDAADQSAPHSVLPEALHTQNALTGEARQKGEKMKQLFGEDRRLTTLLYVNEEAMHRRREERAEIGGRLEKARDEEDAGTREDKAFQDEVKARNKTWRDLCASTPTATTAAGSPCVAVGLFGIYEVAAGVPLDSVEAFEDAFDGAQTGNVTLMHYAAAYVPSSFYTPVSLVYDSPLLKRNRKEAVKDGRPPVSNGDTRRENEGDTSEKTRTQEGTETPHTDRGGDTKGLAVDRRMASAQGDRKRTVEAPANVHARQRDGGSHRKVRTPFDFRLASADALLFVYELDSSRGDAADFDAWESAASSWAVSVRKTREERRREKQTVGLFQKAKQREESGSEAEADPTDLREASQRRTARNGRSSDSNGDTGLISLLSQFMPSLASSTSFASTSSFEGGSSSSRFTAGESGVPWSVHAFNSQVASRESVFTVARETPLLLYTFGLVSLFLLLVFGLLGRLSLRVCLLLTLGAHVVTLFSVAGGFCLAHLLWRLPVTPLAPLVLHLLLGFVSQFSLSTLLQLRRARERETKKRDASDQHSLAHQKLQRSQRFQRPLQRQAFESRGFCVSPRHHEEELVSDWMPDQGKFHGTEEFLGESARDVVRFETAGDESPHPCASPLFPTSRNPGCTYAGVEGPRASLVARMSLPLQLPSAALPTSFPAFVRNEARRRSCPSGAREDGCVQETGRLERGSGTSHFRIHALHATSRTPWQQLVLRSDSRLRMLRRVIAASFSGLLLTSLTCVAALLLTSTIDLPAVAFFSQAAASAVVALFFFHIFFFCPLLVRLEQPSLAVGTPESFSGVRTLPPAVPRPLDAREGSGEGRGRGVEKGEAREGAWGRDAEDGEEGRRARGDRQAMPSAATAAEAEEREQSCCLSIGWSTQITGESADTAQFVAGTVRHARGGRSECGLDSHAVGDSDKSVGDRQDTLFREPCCSDGPRESILPIDADLSPLGPEGMPPPQPEGVSIAFKSRPLHVDTTLVFSTSSASRREAAFHASGFDYFHENPNSVSSPRPASYRLCGCGGRGRELGKPGGHPETPLSSRDAASDCVSAGVAPPPAFVSGTVVARPFPEGARTWDESTGKGRDKEYRRESRPGEGSAREIEREAMLHARQAQIVVGAGGEEEVLSEDSDDFFALARDDEEADLGCSQPHFFTDPDGHATRERKIQNRRDMLFSGSGRVSHEASPAHMIEEENTQESRGFQRTCLTPRGSNGGKEEERSEYRTPRSDGTTSGELLVYVHSRREDEGRYREGERTGRSRARDVGRPEDLFADSIHEPREETSSCNAEHRNVPGGSYLEASATPEGDQGEEPRRKKPRRKANKGFRVWDFFTRRRNRRVVLAAFFLLTVTSGLLSRQLGTSFDLLTYLSRDSPLLSFFNAVVFFWPSGLPSKLYLYLPGEDEVQYHDVRQRRKIISFLEELETLHEVQVRTLCRIRSSAGGHRTQGRCQEKGIPMRTPVHIHKQPRIIHIQKRG
ncbi:putative patched family protein, partial [Toxoplasma gondii MAS]